MEQVNQQQIAVLSNLSATESLEQVLRSELERKTDTENSSKVQESTLKKALEGKTGKLGTEILASLASKLAKALPTSQKILGNLEKEYEFILNPEEESAQDLVDIRNPISRAARSQKFDQQNQQTGANSREGEEAPQKASDVKEYIGAYSQMLVTGGSEIKKKTDQLENRLLNEKGVSPKDLQSVKVQVANTVRAEILRQLKETYLKQVLTQSKSLEGIIARKETQNFIDFAFANDRLGGYDFGGLEESLQGAADKTRAETAHELREYLNDALKQEVMKKAMGSESKQVEKDIEALLKLGNKVGFDVQQFINQIPKMKDDLGLNPLVNYEFVPADANMDGDRREGHRYQYTPEEEKEVLTDKLRALYLRRALHGDLRSVLETQFKMVKLKNGLIRLGARNFDEIETEGKALAKVKLFDMLREAFEERATYAKLSGEAWKMTERKIKTILRNLEKLGIQLSQTELDIFRDKANEKMYHEAEHELSLINTAIEARGEVAYLTSKRKMALGIMERIASESGLQGPGDELKLSIEEAC
jgi:hypothetical protein